MFRIVYRAGLGMLFGLCFAGEEAKAEVMGRVGTEVALDLALHGLCCPTFLQILK